MSALLRTDVDSLVRPSRRNDRPTAPCPPGGFKHFVKEAGSPQALLSLNFSTNNPSNLAPPPPVTLSPAVAAETAPGALKAEDREKLTAHPADGFPACHRSLFLLFKHSRKTVFFKPWPRLHLQVLRRLFHNARRRKMRLFCKNAAWTLSVKSQLKCVGEAETILLKLKWAKQYLKATISWKVTKDKTTKTVAKS